MLRPSQGVTTKLVKPFQAEASRQRRAPKPNQTPPIQMDLKPNWMRRRRNFQRSKPGIPKPKRRKIRRRILRTLKLQKPQLRMSGSGPHSVLIKTSKLAPPPQLTQKAVNTQAGLIFPLAPGACLADTVMRHSFPHPYLPGQNRQAVPHWEKTRRLKTVTGSSQTKDPLKPRLLDHFRRKLSLAAMQLSAVSPLRIRGSREQQRLLVPPAFPWKRRSKQLVLLTLNPKLGGSNPA